MGFSFGVPSSSHRGRTLLLDRSKLCTSHWSNQWLTSKIELRWVRGAAEASKCRAGSFFSMRLCPPCSAKRLVRRACHDASARALLCFLTAVWFAVPNGRFVLPSCPLAPPHQPCKISGSHPPVSPLRFPQRRILLSSRAHGGAPDIG